MLLFGEGSHCRSVSQTGRAFTRDCYFSSGWYMRKKRLYSPWKYCPLHRRHNGSDCSKTILYRLLHRKLSIPSTWELPVWVFYLASRFHWSPLQYLFCAICLLSSKEDISMLITSSKPNECMRQRFLSGLHVLLIEPDCYLYTSIIYTDK